MTNKRRNRQPKTTRKAHFFVSPDFNCWFCQTEPLPHPFGVRTEHRGLVFIYGVCSLTCAAGVVGEIPDLSPIVVSEDEVRDFIEQRHPMLIKSLRVGRAVITEIPATFRKSESQEPTTNRGEDSV